MSDNTTRSATVGGDTIRNIDKGGVKTQVNILDISGNGTEELLTAGQKLSAHSVPVVIASDQSAIPVTGTVTVASVSGTVAATQSGSWSLTADTELTTADLDTGAGTDTHAAVGLRLAESGGSQLVGSAHPMPVSGSVSLSGTVTITGDVSPGSADNTNPVKIGGVANAGLPTAVSSGQRINAWYTTSGATVAAGYDGSTSRTLKTNSSGELQVGVIGVVDITPASPAANDYLPVRLTDGSAFYTASGGGGGGGTEYTEDAAAPADPVGGMVLARRKDTLSVSEVSADGDVIALNATSKGQLHAKLSDTVVVDGSGVTQPVSASALPLPSGASTAAKQPALGTAGTASADVISIQGVASMTAVKTDGSGVTQPVSASSLPLPSGASSAAKQPALGTAGSASADVISVQGVASMTPLKTDGSGVTQPVSGTFWQTTQPVSLAAGAVAAGATSFVKLEDVASADSDAGVPAMAIRKASPANTSSNDGDYEMLQMSAGRLWTSAVIDTALPAGSAVIGHVITDSGSTTTVTQATGSNLHMVVDSGTVTTVSAVTAITNALPAGSNVIGHVILDSGSTTVLGANSGVDIGKLTANQTVDLNKVAGTTTDTNSGNKSAGTLRVVLATDQPALTNKLLVTPDANSTVDLNKIAGTTTATGNGVMTAGTQRVSIASDCAVLLNGADTTATGNLTSATTGVALAIAGYYGAGFILTGTWSGTIVARYSTDGGTTYVTGQIYDTANKAVIASTTSNGTYQFLEIGGMSHVQVYCSAYTSGTIVVTARATIAQTFVDASANRTINISQIASGTAINSGVTGALAAGGDTAAAATDAGNPLKIGGVGKTANPTAVTDGQRVNALFDKLGKQVVVGAIRDLKGITETTITSSTSETTIVGQVGSTFMDLYGLVITNTSATTCKVTIKDSTAGTTRFVFEVPATDTRGFMVSADSAVPQATVNTNWSATCGTSVASIEISALWVKNI